MVEKRKGREETVVKPAPIPTGFRSHKKYPFFNRARKKNMDLFSRLVVKFKIACQLDFCLEMGF